MLPNEVLLTFVLVLGIIGAIYYVAILRPEQEQQGALRRRLKTGVTAVKAVGAGLRRRGVSAQRDSGGQSDPGIHRRSQRAASPPAGSAPASRSPSEP